MRRVLLAALFWLLPFAAYAANCSSNPFTLTNGQTADATQVMSNFNNLLNCANNNLAHNGANSDITSLTGLTTPISVAEGGSGVITVASGALIVGQNASPFTTLAPASDGNIVTAKSGVWLSSVNTSGLADVQNGGMSIAYGTTNGTIGLSPGDLTLKTSPLTTDFFVIEDGSTGLLGKRAQVSALVPVSKLFTSTQQTITASGTLTIAHGLGNPPKFMTFQLICVTNDQDFSAGQIIEMPAGSQGNNQGMAARADSVNIVITFGSGSGGNVFTYIEQALNTTVSLTNASWKLIVRAYL